MAADTAGGTAAGTATGGGGARRRVLITNDDGVDSEGLRWLALAARDAGLDPLVAAPLQEASGCGAGVTMVEAHGRVVVEERRLDGLDGVPVYGVASLPAFITLIAVRGAFGPAPDLVLSGINRGTNTGHAVLHSGTVGAVLTAVNHGVPAMAMSVGMSREPRWDTAVDVLSSALPLLLAADRPMALNVNVPNLPIGEVRGLRHATLAAFGTVEIAVAEVGEGFVRVAIRDGDERAAPGTDEALLAEGYATITALRSVGEDAEAPLPALTEISSGSLTGS
jgi:5'-nucleotidase